MTEQTLTQETVVRTIASRLISLGWTWTNLSRNPQCILQTLAAHGTQLTITNTGWRMVSWKECEWSNTWSNTCTDLTLKGALAAADSIDTLARTHNE